VRLAAAAAVLLLCAGIAAAAPEKPKLDLPAFFTGRTHAENVLKIAFHRAVPLRVDTVGKVEGKQFVLVDTVHEGDKPARIRKWVTREVSPGHYRGTLSDATSPVDIVVSGDRAVVQYVMKGGLRVRQQMNLLADGKTIANHVVVKKFGMRFATVEGKIRKLD
jgi:hypothetical protein